MNSVYSVYSVDKTIRRVRQYEFATVVFATQLMFLTEDRWTLFKLASSLTRDNPVSSLASGLA